MAMTAAPINMGTTDRIVRGIMGGLMLWNGLNHLRYSGFRKLETLVGGAFLVYGITGFDPLLQAFGVSTIPGNENNVLKVAKEKAANQGITQQQTENIGMSVDESMADATAIS
jgi:hypothetical protein